MTISSPNMPKYCKKQLKVPKITLKRPQNGQKFLKTPKWPLKWPFPRQIDHNTAIVREKNRKKIGIFFFGKNRKKNLRKKIGFFSVFFWKKIRKTIFGKNQKKNRKKFRKK